MAIKELQTRIALKYDSYAAWTDDSVAGKGANLVLLPGEIGICEIPAIQDGVSNVAPTVLFKVGGAKYENGTLKAFKDLPWASAKAADVYSWAKASDVVLEGKTIKFVGTDKTITLNYVTEAEVKDITDPIAADVAALKTNLGANGTTGKAIAAVESRLDAIEGDSGAIATAAAGALADAKEYTDTREAAIKTAYEGYADKAEEDAITAANAYTDGKVTVINAKTSELENAIGNNSTAINTEVTNRTNADNAINAKFGDGIDATNTVVDAIAAAKQAAIDSAASTAQSKVDTLANGTVAQNTKKANDNAAAIAKLQTDLAAEAKARGDKDTNLEERLTEVETFFKTAEGETLDTALDTLVEIQKYLTGDGDAASDLISRVSENEKDIAALEKTLAKDGDFEKRVAAVEAASSANTNSVATLQSLTSGYAGAGAIKAAVDKAQEDATKGIEDAAKAQSTADTAKANAKTAQDEVDALELVVAEVKTTADNAKADLAALTGTNGRIATAEGKISTIEALVNDASKGNEKLRTDVNALQTLTGDAAKGNVALYNEITRVAGLVDNTTTGLAATKAVADEALTKAKDAQSRVAAIEGDYLKAADAYIFNCGSSTTVVHTAN
jgi:hypothetical protein